MIVNLQLCRRWRTFLLCALTLLLLAPRPVRAATEDFEDWPTAEVWGTYTNTAGWVLTSGSVLTDWRWHPPHGGNYAAWLPDRDVATNAAIGSPLLTTGIGKISYWHSAHTFGDQPENMFRMDVSTNGHTWTTVATPASVSTDWTFATHAVGLFAPAYVRFMKTDDTGNDQHLGFDDITVEAPPGIVFDSLSHAPVSPTVGDPVHITATVVGIHPAASNVQLRAWYRFNRLGPFVSREMTEVSASTYRTHTPIPPGQSGTVEYFVEATFEGLDESATTVPAGGMGDPRTLDISGDTGAVYDLGQFGPSTRRGPFTITEIMYHPADRPDGRSGEFIELCNTDPVPHDISGYRLSGQVDYTFPDGTLLPPHGRLVVAADPQVIVGIYPVSFVLGPYSNRLSNGGGTVRLRNRIDALLVDIEYDDDWPWPTSADGAGHSLDLAHPEHGEGERDAWEPSGLRVGTPGFPEVWHGDALSHVVINEFLAHTDLPQTDFIELYNRGTQAVNIGGCVLTDTPETNAFTIPHDTVIPPGGHVWFDQATLQFSLSMHGDDIYLIDTNANRVLDAVRFPAQANGIATGRQPDGSDELRVLRSDTPGQPNSAPQRCNVVINEIMFNPMSADSDDEYVELHNTAATNVNIGHWRFTKGIDYSIPPGTVVPAGGYVVVARDAARLMAKYPQLDENNTLGDFSGRLSDRGERLVLSRPDDMALPDRDFVVVDTVAYGDGDNWGRWIDGNGSSLELIDPRADNRCAMNWAGSDETEKAPWTTVEYTGSMAYGKSGASEARAYLLQAGECLFDDIQIVAPGGTVYLDWDFEAGQGSWSFWGNHSRSTFETGTGHNGGNCMHIRASGRGDNGNDTSRWNEAFYNRASAPLSQVPPNGQILTIRARARWLAGWPHGIVGIRGYWMEAPVALHVPENLGSPGLQNSRYATNRGPAISAVLHTPALPAANEDVRITCRAVDPDGIAGVALAYRVDPSTSVTTTNMNDSGLGGDLQAGDGVYSATIRGLGYEKLVAFAVVATDGTAESSRYPLPEPAGAPERECLVRFGHGPPGQTEFDDYHLWLTAANVNRWQTIAGGKYSNEPIATTVVYDGRHVEYNAGARFRGLWRGYGSPETSGAYSISLFESLRVLGGREIKIDQPGQRGSDGTLQKENYCYWMAKQVDLPGCHIHFVRVTVNGGYRGVRHDLQTPALDFCESWYNDPNPSAFKGVGWTDDPFGTYRDALGNYQKSHYRWNLRKRRPTPPDDDFSPVYALAAAFDTQEATAYTRRVDALLDVREWLSYFALNAAVTGWDSYGYS